MMCEIPPFTETAISKLMTINEPGGSLMNACNYFGAVG